jgi:single-strand selective monofunctional uracil DNA glycosylase
VIAAGRPRARLEPTSTAIASAICAASRRLHRETVGLTFGPPVTHVYHPLEYARAPHEAYLRRYGATTKRVIFVGMNPGPFGMAQTGVPFGDVARVRDWLGIQGRVGVPRTPHPLRPVEGFACPRSEVSGARLWGAIATHYGNPEGFFRDHFVANYCPLVFMEDSGRNRTPDKLAAAERASLFAACDRHLARVVAVLEPEWVIGIGRFAADRARAALGAGGPKIAAVLHPSPASPAANRGWESVVLAELRALGLCSRPMPPRLSRSSRRRSGD